MRSGWKETTLGEVADFCYGKMPDKSRVLSSGMYPVFSGYRVVGYYDEFNSDEDLIIVARGVGGTGDVKISPSKSYVTNLSIIARLKHNKVSKKYLAYKYLRNNLRYLDSGSAQSQITITDLQRIEVVLPSLPEQRAIAGVLSSFDDKIELLREQNKTLEATAQAIFKEWFVNFEFPVALCHSREGGNPDWIPNQVGDDRKGYKSSGDKMIDSELGEIPERWQIVNLKDFGRIVCGKTPSKSNVDFFRGEIPFIKIPDMHNQIFITRTEDSLSELGAYSQKNKFIPRNSICVSCIATVGLVSIASQDSQTNQQVNSIIIGSEDFLEYLYFSLCEMKNDLLAIGSGGSATLNINMTTFSKIKILKPDERLLSSYHSTMNPIFEKILSNLEQIQILSKIRDTLLPKLMTGKLRVGGF